MLQLWDIINRGFIHQSHHHISNLKSTEIKILWTHSRVAVKIPCHCQTTRSIHFQCSIYISFHIVVHVWPSVSDLIILLLQCQITMHPIIGHDSFSIWSISIVRGNLLTFNVSSNNACYHKWGKMMLVIASDMKLRQRPPCTKNTVKVENGHRQ